MTASLGNMRTKREILRFHMHERRWKSVKNIPEEVDGSPVRYIAAEYDLLCNH